MVVYMRGSGLETLKRPKLFTSRRGAPLIYLGHLGHRVALRADDNELAMSEGPMYPGGSPFREYFKAKYVLYGHMSP